MAETIYTFDWTELLPDTLRQDTDFLAAEQAISEEKNRVANEIWRARIWNNLDRQPEEVLDALAQEMYIDWYDFNATEEQKRAILKNAVYIRQELGTRSSVERAMQELYPDARISEWFEYAGRPYYFKLIITQTESTDLDKILETLYKVKPVSAWLEGLVQEREAEVNANVAVFLQSAVDIEIWPTDTSIPVYDVQLSLDESASVMALAGPQDVDTIDVQVQYEDTVSA